MSTGVVVAVARLVQETVSEVLGNRLTTTRNVMELGQTQGLIRIGTRGQPLHLNLQELVAVLLGHAAEPRNELGILVPKWRVLPAVDHSIWSGTGFAADELSLRSCCFAEVGIALDDYRDQMFPNLPKILDKADRWSGGQDYRCFQTLPGATFGDALDSFVDYLSKPESIRLKLACRAGDWRMQISNKGDIRVSYIEAGKTFTSFFQPENLDLRRPALLTSWAFSFAAVEAIANLWADTKAHIADNPPDRVKAQSKKKKAAGAPPPSDPPKPKQAARVCEAVPVHNWQTNTHEVRPPPDRRSAYFRNERIRS